MHRVIDHGTMIDNHVPIVHTELQVLVYWPQITEGLLHGTCACVQWTSSTSLSVHLLVYQAPENARRIKTKDL